MNGLKWLNYPDHQLTIAVSGVIDTKLLPHLSPVKFGNAFLLKYILNERRVGDDLHLVLHSSAMGYLFRSFPVLCNYDPNKVDSSLCAAKLVLVTFIWSY